MYVIAKLRLGDTTCKINTASGIEMRTAWGFADVESEEGLLVGVVAFSYLAGELAKYGKGRTIRVSGIFKRNEYTAKDGAEKKGWQIVADGIAGIKSARGKYSTPKPQGDPNQASQMAQQPDFNDELGF